MVSEGDQAHFRVSSFVGNTRATDKSPEDPERRMACDYHCNVTPRCRAKGDSATAGLEYVSRSGRYAGRDAELEFLATENLPSWAADAREYFAATDKYERANGRLGESSDIAIPHLLTDRQGTACLLDFAQRVYGDTHVYTVAIHSGKAREPGDPRPRNRHAHVLASDRQLDGIERTAETHFKRANKKNPARGGAAKDPAMSDKGWIEHVRTIWEEVANEHLERAGHPDRIDRRSLVAQRADALARGDHDAAARFVTQLQERFPDSTWAAQAAEQFPPDPN